MLYEDQPFIQKHSPNPLPTTPDLPSAADDATLDAFLNTLQDGKFVDGLSGGVDMSDADFGTPSQLHLNGEKEIAYTGAAGIGLVFEGTLAADLAFLFSNPLASRYPL